MSNVRHADCCGHCANVYVDFIFRDAVRCKRRDEYILKTEVCDEFEREAEKT